VIICIDESEKGKKKDRREVKWVQFAITITIASILTQKASTRLLPLVPIIISIFNKQFSINILFIYAQYYIKKFKSKLQLKSSILKSMQVANSVHRLPHNSNFSQSLSGSPSRSRRQRLHLFFGATVPTRWPLSAPLKLRLLGFEPAQ